MKMKYQSRIIQYHFIMTAKRYLTVMTPKWPQNTTKWPSHDHKTVYNGQLTICEFCMQDAKKNVLIKNWFSHDEYFKFHVLKSILITRESSCREFPVIICHQSASISWSQQFLDRFLFGGGVRVVQWVMWIAKLQV